jgi:hypothetical protein
MCVEASVHFHNSSLASAALSVHLVRVSPAGVHPEAEAMCNLCLVLKIML